MSNLSAYTYAAVTPHDTTPLANGVCDGLYIGTTGNITVQSADGTNVLFTAPTLGVIHPIRTRIVRSTGTTAGAIVACYFKETV